MTTLERHIENQNVRGVAAWISRYSRVRNIYLNPRVYIKDYKPEIDSVVEYALEYAVRVRSFKVINYLIKKYKFADSTKYLDLAIAYNNVQLVDYFLKMKNINVDDRNYLTLLNPVREGHVPMLKRLLKDPRINKFISEKNNTLFEYALMYDQYDVAKILLKHPQMDKTGTCRIILNAQIPKNRINVVKYILKTKNIIPDFDMIHRAIIANVEKIFDLLFELYPDKNNPEILVHLLHICIESYHDVSNIFKKIYKRYKRYVGSELNVGSELINFAVERDKLEIVKILVDDGFIPDSQAIDYAFRKQNIKMLRYLIEKGVQIDPPDNEVLFDTVSYGKIDTLKLLLEIGVDPSVENNKAYELGKYNPEITKILKDYHVKL